MKTKLVYFLTLVVAIGLILDGFTAVRAQESAKDEFTLEEITVTAQKRTEKLQQMTVAASVLSADVMEANNTSNITDLNFLVPSVELKGSINGRVPMSIRGISTNADESAIDGVSIMVDGVSVPSDSMGANELEDIKSVEVLKGPQSTLGGRTASAGVINIITKSPSKTFTGSVGITATTDKELRLQGFLSGPVSDKVGFSLSASSHKIVYLNRNLDGGEHSNSDSKSVRAKLSFNPNDNLSILLTGHILNYKSEGADIIYEYLTPGARLFPYMPYPAPPSFGLPQSMVLPGINVHYGNTDYVSPVKNSGADIHDKDLSLKLDYTLGRNTLSSISAYQNEDRKNIQDIPVVGVYFWNIITGGNAPPYYNFQTLKFDITSLTQEFKITSPAEDPINFVAGLFYSDVAVKSNQVMPWVGNPSDFDRKAVEKTMAAYGRVKWNFAEKTKLVTGLRFNRDDLSFSEVQRVSPEQPQGVIYAPPRAEDTSTALVGDITVEQNFSSNRMAYLTYARGYKPKTYNTAKTLTSNAPFDDPVGQEKINHFELGSKGTYADGRLIMNVAAFDTIYKNYQVQIFDTSELVPVMNLQAAGEAETRGLEVDMDAIPTDNLKLNLSAAYIDAKFNDFKNAPSYHGQTPEQGAVNGIQDLSGKPMPDSPKFKVTLGVEQRIVQAALPVDIIVGAHYSYRTETLMRTNQNPKTKQPAFGIMNFNIKAVSLSDRYSLMLFVNNVFDQFYLTNSMDVFSGIWDADAVIGFPGRDAKRYAGLKFSVNF